MSKRSRRIRRPLVADAQIKEIPADATPERLAKGDAWEFVNPGKIDSSEQPIGRARRFIRADHLARWHNAEIITQRQWWAGEAYRKLHESIEKMPKVVASYGERTTGGQTDYGMARTAAQARRRRSFRDARGDVSAALIGMLDLFVLRNALPKYRGRRQMHAISAIRDGLDQLADHFERRRCDDSLDERNVLLYGLL